MFNLAIKELINSHSLVGRPQSFHEYKRKVGVKKNIRTAEYLSIYSIEDLKEELASAKCTIFRLGSPKGERYSYFAISKIKTSWNDYFLIDDEIFSKNIEFYDLSKNKDVNYLFNILPSLSEKALVQLSLATGILFKALNIRNIKNIIPATGSGSYTFSFKPLKDFPELTHYQGQVEIDSFFIAKRDKKKCLFIIEAKSNKSKSLAKHKLLYPILSMQSNIDPEIEVVPVYLKFIQENAMIYINIVECKLPKINNIFGSIEELVPVNSIKYRINL